MEDLCLKKLDCEAWPNGLHEHQNPISANIEIAGSVQEDMEMHPHLLPVQESFVAQLQRTSMCIQMQSLVKIFDKTGSLQSQSLELRCGSHCLHHSSNVPDHVSVPLDQILRQTIRTCDGLLCRRKARQIGSILKPDPNKSPWYVSRTALALTIVPSPVERD